MGQMLPESNGAHVIHWAQPNPFPEHFLCRHMFLRPSHPDVRLPTIGRFLETVAARIKEDQRSVR
jgi:hypothetical protein